MSAPNCRSSSGGEKVWCEFTLDDGTALLPCIAWRPPPQLPHASSGPVPHAAPAATKCIQCSANRAVPSPRCSLCGGGGGGGGGESDGFSWMTRLVVRGGVAHNRLGHLVEVLATLLGILIG